MCSNGISIGVICNVYIDYRFLAINMVVWQVGNCVGYV